MSEIAICVEMLSKRYAIGALKRRHDTLRDHVAESLKGLFSRNGQSDGNLNDIWALKDLFLEVHRGEAVGIIGRNGAGKSTLLKILSRITEPTEGRARIHGRVGSLLEVGTGFHQELTGRENIYLNGAILGMKKAEIDLKFDPIVAFAEIERFIDTPVKRYSSGMYVRLAFAVAAHLDFDILLIDEILAVGDARFQEKCIGTMEKSASSGKTVVFVSHNMAAIKALCSRAILLDAGRVAYEGNVDRTVETYLMAGREMSKTGIILDDVPRPWGTFEAKIRSVQLADASGRVVSELYFGQPFRLSLAFEMLKDIPDAVIEVGIATPDGTRVTYSSNTDYAKPPAYFPKGRHTVAVDMDIILLPRQYVFDVGIHHADGQTIDWVERALDFEVLNVSKTGGDHYPWPPPVRGYVRPVARWQVHKPFEPLTPILKDS